MSYQLSDPAFAPLFLGKLQERLSGTTVMPIDQAENIKKSIEFVLAHGEGETLSLRFERGKENLRQRLNELLQLYNSLKGTYKSFGIESLDESIKEIGNFFNQYDLEYGAAEVDQAFLDYQLAEPVPVKFVGLDFYQRYIENLAAETFFINHLPEDQIYELLAHYQNKLGFDYRKDVNNLFEVVFKQIIGKVLAEKNENASLLLNPIEAQYAFSQIKQQHEFPQLSSLFQLNDYYRRIFQQIQLRVRRLEGAESAVHFFLTKTPAKRFLELPLPMSETSFNQFVNAYAIADQTGKIELVKAQILAPEDFVEYLIIYPESKEFLSELFKNLSKDFIMSLFIWEKEKNRLDTGPQNADAKALSGIEHLLKDYLKTLTTQQKLAFLTKIDTFQLTKLDFS